MLAEVSAITGHLAELIRLDPDVLDQEAVVAQTIDHVTEVLRLVLGALDSHEIVAHVQR
jgi:hypothetical protein